jgi:hypothetical protein
MVSSGHCTDLIVVIATMIKSVEQAKDRGRGAHGPLSVSAKPDREGAKNWSLTTTDALHVY